MAIVEMESFSFAYPGADPVFSDVSLSVEEGEFCLLVGATGSGKTTLLRALKPELAPVGDMAGTIRICGVETVSDGRRTDALPQRDSASSVGFVMQDPAAQIVCDTVWHELAFGLENLGFDQDIMRRRIAEVAHFFGIGPWVRQATETLSGGQKQLVNLAAVLALRPRVLLLDEPTAQLDPNAVKQFLFMLSRVNRELGVTVVMATHSPEDAAGFATRTIAMGPAGETEQRGRTWERLAWSRMAAQRAAESAPAAVTCDDVRFRYHRDDQWVLRGVDVRVACGSVHAIVGGNGCGKSTLLRAMAGILKPQRGRLDNALRGSQAMLPQDPKALFVCDSVAEELAEWRGRCGYSQADEGEMLERFGLAGTEARHPYDLSGGQQQKLALAKLLLCRPRLLLLDEPTKGLDPESCADVSRILRAIAADGCTVVFVSHDLDFAFVTADMVSMLFDGETACTEPVQRFFEGNLVYRANDASRLFALV